LPLCLLSGPASIVQARNISLLDLAPKKEDELYVHQLNEDHRIFFQGDFTGFHMYALVTHTKFKVNKDSVKLIDHYSFKAEIIFEKETGEEITKLVEFNSPLIPISSVTACKYGRDYDSFEFSFYNNSENKNEKFICDLSFVTNHVKNLDYKVPLCVEYIGMAARNGRTAQDRLGEGHNKLQDILAQLNQRDLFRSASIILYKPGELDCDEITFEQVVETLEASLIQYFKPTPLNIEHLNFPNNRTQLTTLLKNIGADEIVVSFESPVKTALYSKYKPNPLDTHIIDLKVP